MKFIFCRACKYIFTAKYAVKTGVFHRKSYLLVLNTLFIKPPIATSDCISTIPHSHPHG